MSIKSKVLATAATLTLVGGVGMAGALSAAPASAATPSCGGSCVNIFSYEFGTHHALNYVVDVLRQGEKVDQPIILFRTANFDPAEDWSYAFQGTVADFLAAGLVKEALALHYGCIGDDASIGGGNFPNCYGDPAAVIDDPAFEIEYAPFGVDSGLCMGVAATAIQEEGVTLQPCGVSANTVWVVDIFDSPSTLYQGYVPLINGSDTNFSTPFVLDYPESGYPTDLPRPQLQVDNLTGSQQCTPMTYHKYTYCIPGPEVGTVDSNQLWGATLGVLP
jgi:hypothetical protein